MRIEAAPQEFDREVLEALDCWPLLLIMRVVHNSISHCVFIIKRGSLS